jgi:hypothetical protein
MCARLLLVPFFVSFFVSLVIFVVQKIREDQPSRWIRRTSSE